jgi:anti-sigma28 factor (negative regulator of flagellin synthesis)
MKVDPTRQIQGADKPSAAREEARARPPAAEGDNGDRVTIEGHNVAEQLSTAKLRSDSTRTARLEQLEGAIRSGSYRPDAGQLAERLLSTAEIDARLLAMLRG